jgi:hypothetical protein
MKQEVVTFKQVFENLNNLGNGSLFDFDGEKITPLNNRIKLIFIDSLGWHIYDPITHFSSSGLMRVPKQELRENIESNFEGVLSKNFAFIYNSGKATTDRFADGLEDTKICIQTERPSNYERFPKKYITSTEQLGELISMLYFRENGYIVQKPLGTYGREGDNRPGVDDVVAWKSPIVDELRKFGFIDKGCHISELACLRWLGKVSTVRKDLDNYTDNELILVEVKSSTSNGLSKSPSKGIDQLLRAKKEKVAKNLFICFPTVDSDTEEVFTEIKNRMNGEPVVGSILFDDKGLHMHDSEIFSDENVTSEINKYESQLKQVLLNNFYFDEILQMIDELDVDTKNKGLNEVLDSFNTKIETDVSVSYLLEKLNELVK